ncbi:MAG: Ig-like domain-containing protein [Muribaculaceae bacterium]|nr:Ig-like domain-containing protein [Muribaculaceae bacterium]
MDRKPLHGLHALVVLLVTALLAACASMGRPEGGPRDVDPPVYLSSTPTPGELNVNRSKVVIRFNENVALTDPQSKVVISPAQKTTPLITAAGKNIVVELRDTLLDSTTYTIDFSDGIKDLNEGNPIDGFSVAFSTGSHIDTLQISGMVFQASNLEPAQGMLVGVYSNLSDSAVSTLPMERITKTNQYGEFTIRNLKEGTYRIFALNDNNRDYHWDRSEDIAFYDVTVTPTVSSTVVADTLKAADDSDSIVSSVRSVYAPNDIILTWFNENYKPQYLFKYERPERHRISLQMNAHSDTLPDITIVNGPLAGTKLIDKSILNATATLDTLEYWIKDSLLIKQDSILIAARYMRTDSTMNLSWTNDTLRFFIRAPKKASEKKKKDKEKQDSVPPVVFMNFRPAKAISTLEVYDSIYFNASQPLVNLDMDKVHLEQYEDTVWIEIDPPVFEYVSPTKPLQMKVNYDWEPGVKYKLTVDSTAVTGIYDQWNNTTKIEFTVRPLEDYSTVDFTISGIDGPAVVQLLSKSDAPVYSAPVVNGHAVFMHVLPNTYYARLFVDANSNGRYDDGSYTLGLQPEEVYYYPKKLNVRKKWDVEQSWNVTELPIDQQKPSDIKKNKPKPKPGELPEETDEETDEEDEFFIPGSSTSPGNRPNGKRNNRVRQNSGGNRLAI